MGTGSVVKRESFQRADVEYLRLQLAGGDMGTDSYLQICNTDSADQNVTSGILRTIRILPEAWTLQCSAKETDLTLWG